MSFDKIKSLASDSVIYGLSNVVSRMISIWLIPMYTYIFTPSDYGILTLINNTFFLVGILSICALDSSASRFFYDNENELDRKIIFASWFWFQLFISTLLGLVMLISCPLASTYLFELPLKKVGLLWTLACGTLIVNILPNILLNWYRLQRKPVSTVWFSISQSLFTIGLTMLFVLYLKMHIVGVYMALFISGFCFSIIALVNLKSWLHVSFFDRTKIRTMLRFSFPLMPAALAYWMLNSTDSYFLLYFTNKTEVGLFSIGASFASGMYLFTGAFQQAWGAFAYSILHEKDAKQTYANVFLIFGSVSSILILIMFLFSPEMLVLFTNAKYYDAAWVVPILSLNIILIAITYIASLGANIAKTSLPYSYSIMAASFLNIILNILLIPIWGKEGSALATVFAQLLVPIYLFRKSQSLYFIPYKFKTVIWVMGASVVTGVLVRFISFSSSEVALFWKMITLILFIGFTLFFFKRTLNDMMKKLI